MIFAIVKESDISLTRGYPFTFRTKGKLSILFVPCNQRKYISEELSLTAEKLCLFLYSGVISGACV
jgi:hypothetical protein